MPPLPPDEVAEVQNYFSGLRYKPSERVLEGNLNFSADYEGCNLVDAFNVRVFIPNNYPDTIPVVSECGGRMSQIMHKHEKKLLQDVHYNPETNSACLCPITEERAKFPPGSRLIDFFAKLVVPYFYAVSYFEKNGRWPWGEYSHGTAGIFESFLEKRNTFGHKEIINLTEKLDKYNDWKAFKMAPSHDNTCICGLNKKFASCHPKAFSGFRQLFVDSLLMNFPFL